MFGCIERFIRRLQFNVCDPHMSPTSIPGVPEFYLLDRMNQLKVFVLFFKESKTSNEERGVHSDRQARSSLKYQV